MRKACLEPGIAHAIARSITNPKWRSIFVLYSLLDITYKDVAYALGIPHGTVMSGLSRARELLQGSELAIRVLQKFASERVGMVFAEAS